LLHFEPTQTELLFDAGYNDAREQPAARSGQPARLKVSVIGELMAHFVSPTRNDLRDEEPSREPGPLHHMRMVLTCIHGWDGLSSLCNGHPTEVSKRKEFAP
jgi:hypothetical protein